MADLELKLKIQAEIDSAKAKLQDFANGVKDITDKTAEASKATIDAGKSFYDFGANAALTMLALGRSIVSATASLYSFAQSTLGLSVRLETSNLGLKAAGLLIQNLRKEFTLSLGFLSTFSDYLKKVDFPIKQVTQFIDLMSKFRVVIGIGKGATVFEEVKKGAIELGETLKKLTLSNLKQDISQAATSLVLFAANTAVAFKSLREGISRESAFSEASRTIEGTDEQLKALKKTIDDLASSDLSITTEQLYAVAGVAGAMGKSVGDISGFIRTVSEGVVALHIPAAELAERLGSLQTQLDLTEEGLVSLSDQVNSVADTLPKASELDIFTVLSTGVATAGKSFGLLKGETIGLAGALLSLDAAPEVARTSLVNLLSSLQNAKNGTKDFQDGLAIMGTSAGKLAVDIKDKPLPALMQLLDTMHGMSNAGRLDIAEKLLGKGQDAIALSKLVDKVDLLKTAIKTATDETIYSGSVHAAYQKQIATTGAKITLLSNAWGNFSESLTTTFLPAVQYAIDGIRSLVNAASTFSQDHPLIKTVAAISVSILSMAGALRVLKLALTLVGLSPATLRVGLAALGATLVSLNASLLGTVSSLYTLARTGSIFGTLKTALSFLFGGTIGLVIGSIALLAVGISNLLPVVVKWGDTSATVGEIIAAAWDVVLSTFEPIIEIIGNAKDSFDKFLASAFDIADVGELISVVFKKWISVTLQLYSAVGFAATSIAQSWGAIAVEMSAGVQLVEDVLSGNGVGKSMDEFTNRTKANMQQFSDSVGQGFNEAFKGDALDKFAAKTDAALKRKRGEKPLAEADKRAADTGVDVAPVDDVSAAKKRADDIEKIQKDSRDRVIAAIRENEAEKIRLYTNVAQTQQQIERFTFEQKLQTEQSIGLLTNQRLNEELASLRTATTEKKVLTTDELVAKRTALIEIETATNAQIKNLIALEQEHRNKAIGFLNEIIALQQAQTTNNQALDQLGLTASEVTETKRRQLVTDTAQLKKLLAEGEFSQAAELGKKTQALALEFAQSEKKAAVSANQDTEAAREAKRQYNATVGLTIQALEGAKQAETDMANTAAAEANKRKLSLEEVRARIADIEAATKNGTELKVTANTKAVDDAIARIKQPTSSTHTINVVETRTQAHATGGMVYHYANGGFTKKQGAISGKGTGTSDEIPAMLSNGEYVIKADKVAQYGKGTFDAINYGSNPVAIAHYAGGGLVGDDKVKQKVDELKKQAYEQAVAVFNDPRNQIIWRMSGSTSGSTDPNGQERRFEYRVGEYLKANGLPLEWRDMYLNGVKASQVITTLSSSFEEKARASLAMEDISASFSSSTPAQPVEQAPTPAKPTSAIPPTIAPPSLPSITPANFSPMVSRSSSTPTPAGKVSTVKFVSPDGSKSVTGQSQDPNFASFFDELNTVSGVTKQ